MDKVNFERGRVRPNSSLNSSVAYDIRYGPESVVSLEVQATNVLNTMNAINFAGRLVTSDRLKIGDDRVPLYTLMLGYGAKD